MAADDTSDPGSADPASSPGSAGPAAPRPRPAVAPLAPRFPDTARRSAPAPSGELESVRPFAHTGPYGAAPLPSRATSTQRPAMPSAYRTDAVAPGAHRAEQPAPSPYRADPVAPGSYRPDPAAAAPRSTWSAQAPVVQQPAAAPATPTNAQPAMATVFGLVHAPVSQPGYDPFAPSRPSPSPSPAVAAPRSALDDPFEARRQRPGSGPVAAPWPAVTPRAPSAGAAPLAAEDTYLRPATGGSSQAAFDPARPRPPSRPYVDPGRSTGRSPQPAAPAAAPASSAEFTLGASRDRWSEQFGPAVAQGLTPISQVGYAPGRPQRPASQQFSVEAPASSPGFEPGQRPSLTRPGVIGSAPVIATPSGFDPQQRGRGGSSAGVDPFWASRGHPTAARASVATPVQPHHEDFLLALRAVGLQPAVQDAEVHVLAAMAWRWQLGAGETLYGEGDEVGAAFLVGDGILRLECASPDRVARPAASLRPGDWGGEVAFAGGGRHGTAAVAATDAVVFAFDIERIAQLLVAQPGLVVRILGALAQQQARRIRGHQQRIDMFSQLALPRPQEPAAEGPAPGGLGRLLSKLTGQGEEP